MAGGCGGDDGHARGDKGRDGTATNGDGAAAARRHGTTAFSFSSKQHACIFININDSVPRLTQPAWNHPIMSFRPCQSLRPVHVVVVMPIPIKTTPDVNAIPPMEVKPSNTRQKNRFPDVPTGIVRQSRRAK